MPAVLFLPTNPPLRAMRGFSPYNTSAGCETHVLASLHTMIASWPQRAGAGGGAPRAAAHGSAFRLAPRRAPSQAHLEPPGRHACAGRVGAWWPATTALQLSRGPLAGCTCAGAERRGCSASHTRRQCSAGPGCARRQCVTGTGCSGSQHSAGPGRTRHWVPAPGPSGRADRVAASDATAPGATAATAAASASLVAAPSYEPWWAARRISYGGAGAAAER